MRLVRAALATSRDDLPAAVVEKAKICLLDFLGSAFEARDLPWSRQAIALAAATTGGATVIGAPCRVPHAEAAFANGVLGHGLVREDMHAGSVSHLGVVVLPTLLALAELHRVDGREFVAATAVGYEVGARIGRALIDPDVARRLRPTGITGPLAGTAAGARLLRLGTDAAASALALAANTVAGLNEWAHTGGSEMFFHPGFAARNAVTAVRLAELGAYGSPTALDGEAGLFAAFGKAKAAADVALFDGPPEILAVYQKPAPACNFAQTACQAALRLARDLDGSPDAIAAVTVRVPHAAAAYPGCDFKGPFARRLQAKMSIQYNVA
ncbi:MAG TPA: MmgE/PrpD family protein, partial [Thermodesulfobacteriota bacterium]